MRSAACSPPWATELSGKSRRPCMVRSQIRLDDGQDRPIPLEEPSMADANRCPNCGTHARRMRLRAFARDA